MIKISHNTLIYFLYIPILAIVLGACHDDTFGDVNNDNNITNEEMVWLKTILHCSDATKDISSVSIVKETEPGKGYETVINKATLYLYDSNTKKLYKQFNLSGITKNTAFDTSTYDVSYITDSIKVKVGKYDLFVIANCNHTPTNILDESEFLNYIDTTSYNEGVIASISSNGIVMTSCAFANRNTVLSGQEGKKEININIERALAKIYFEQESAYYTLSSNEGDAYATVNITNAKITNAPKQYYFYKHTAELNSFTKPADGYNYFSNLNEEEENVYVIDPYFFLKTQTAPDSAKMDNYYAEWYKRPGLAYETPVLYPGKVIFYVTENPVYITSQKKAYATGLLLKAAISPTSNSVLYWDETEKIAKVEEYQEHWPDTLYFYNYKFYISVKDLNKCKGLALDESKQGRYTDRELEAFHVKQIVKQQTTYQVMYAYWIRHNDNKDENVMAPKEFNIIRNNYYKLHLKNIRGIGTTEINTDYYMEDVEPNSYLDMEY